MPHPPLLLSLALGLAALLGGAFASSEAEPEQAPGRIETAALLRPATGLSCEVREIRSGSVRMLEAVVEGAGALAGDYRFAVTSRGPGGSSRSAQNGTFELPAKGRTVLGEIGIDAAADFDARVTLTLPGDEVVCEAEG